MILCTGQGHLVPWALPDTSGIKHSVDVQSTSMGTSSTRRTTYSVRLDRQRQEALRLLEQEFSLGERFVANILPANPAP